MSAPELLPCPFCGNFPTMGRVNVSFCKTDGCIIEHRAIDLNLPEHIAAWNTRAVYPNTRVVTVDQLEQWAVYLFEECPDESKEIRAIIGEVK
jgi:hypothetical protein